MATTSTGSRPLMEMNQPMTEDPEADADAEGSASIDNERSLFDDCEESPGSSEKQPLSMKRRVALVGALLLCVFTIFAFAFLLPCHKPKCQKVPGCPGKGHLTSVNWTHHFGGIIPVMTSLVDVTGNGKPDILVEFDIEAKESTNSSFLSDLCKNRNCHGGGLFALHGSCGNSLWVFRRNSSLGFLACEGVMDRTDINNNKHCLFIEEQTNLVLFNSENGTTKWQTSSHGVVSSFKFVNDIDSDGERDIVFVKGDNEGDINLISGKTGKVLGNAVPLPGGHGTTNILATHALSSKQQFVIVGSVSFKKNSTSLWAISVHDLLEKIAHPTESIPGEPWGKHKPDPLTGFISILQGTLVLIQPLLTDLDGDGVKDVVFVIRENGTSVLAMNGDDLAVMWKMVVPSDALVHKLFSTQHSVKENSTDIGLFVAHANSSTTLLVIDGHTGEISWSFHTMTGLAVAPVPVPGLFSTKQAFVIWLPKLEAVTLMSKSRISKDISQQVSDGNFGDTSESVNKYSGPQRRKLLSVTSDLVEKNKPRHRLHQEVGSLFSESVLTSPEEMYNHEFDNDYDFDFDNNDDSSKDYSDDMASKELQLVILKDILENFDDSNFARNKLYNTLEEDDKADKKRHGTREENLPIVHQRGYSKQAAHVPFTENRRLPKTIHGKSASGKESSESRADQPTNLEEELSDLSTHEKEEKKAPLASSSSNPSFLLSSPKLVKDLPPGPTRRENEDVNVKMSSGRNNDDRQFSTEYLKKGDSKLASAKKPSYRKRSVPSSQLGSKCVKSFGDSADAYVAVLIMKALNGEQLITEIIEEDPLYLGPEEYDSLFKTKKRSSQPKSCLRLVPHIVSQPVIRDSDEGLDLVYTVNFVSEDHGLHVTKIRKMSVEVAFEHLEGKVVSKDFRRHQTKRQNDYSFSFPRVLK